VIVSGMEEYSAALADFTEHLESKITEWADKAQEWADYTMDMHPDCTRFSADLSRLPRAHG